MKKLMLLAMVSITAITGCPKKDADKKVEPVMKPVGDPVTPDKATPDKAVTPDKPVTDDKAVKPDDKAAPIAGALPTACTDYKAAVELAAACDKLGAQRDTLKTQYATASAGWDKLDAAGKTALAATCQTSADTVKAATKTACP